MNFSAKQTKQSPDVVHCMRGFKFELRHQIIDEHSGSSARSAVDLPSTQRISLCWPDTNDLLCELSPQNRVRNCGSSTYLPSRVVTVVKQHDGNNDGSARGRLRRQLGGDALHDGSTRGHLSLVLKCEHKGFVRIAARLMPIRNNV